MSSLSKQLGCRALIHNTFKAKIYSDCIPGIDHTACLCAEFKGEKLIQRHMERLGGVERMHEQIYSAVTTQRRESLNMALMSFGRLLSRL